MNTRTTPLNYYQYSILLRAVMLIRLVSHSRASANMNSPAKLFRRKDSSAKTIETLLTEKPEWRISELIIERSERSGSFSFLPSFSSFSSIRKRKKRPNGASPIQGDKMFYDSENRLTKIEDESGNKLGEYIYDQAGQRTKKILKDGSVVYEFGGIYEISIPRKEKE